MGGGGGGGGEGGREGGREEGAYLTVFSVQCAIGQHVGYLQIDLLWV